ncbi:guanine nucleotide-binding protein subunit beta-like protein 1 isoform X5 [Choloepus didactylus]|uniref:guanine nucleotide-binding protein subunit beta-like protein 1 isoform X5 n=1 Tax=Choloepus didactylus TaxID=27675 RepID=UPI00189EFE74|nr:guanine nucleotide-binding protein subunit beta-like protein 1 isoform X5 [Choloepus didactylus]
MATSTARRAALKFSCLQSGGLWPSGAAGWRVALRGLLSVLSQSRWLSRPPRQAPGRQTQAGLERGAWRPAEWDPRAPLKPLGRGNQQEPTSGRVRVLEMPSKTPVCTLRTEAGARLGMPMSLRLWQANDRPLLLAGYEDGSVALWSVPERRAVSRAVCHPEPVLGLDFDPRGARGVSGSAGKALAVWSLDEQQTLKVCSTHELTNPGVADVVLRPDRKILATAGWDHRVRVFRWSTMKPLAVLDFHRASVHCVAFAANGLLAAGSGDERISVWDLYPNT